MKGQSTKSIRKKTFSNQRTPLIGIKNTRFYHKAVANETVLNLASLVAPAGFTNPSPSELASLNLGFLSDNLVLVSAVRGQLIEGLSYQVTTSTSIKLLFPTYEGEIFAATFQNASIDGTLIADVRSPNGSGTLLESTTDFNLGEAVKILDLTSQYPMQIVRGTFGPMARNTSNAVYAGDPTIGNYQMVDRGDGWCQVIRFNVAGDIGGEPILWASHGSLGERPQLSMMQYLESMAGVLDRIKDDALIDFGYDVTQPTRYDGAPTSSDLKAFGDLVLLLNQKLGQQFIFKQHCQQIFDPAAMTSAVAGTLRFGTVTFTGDSLLTYTDGDGKFTNNTTRDIVIDVSFNPRSVTTGSLYSIAKGGITIKSSNKDEAAQWGEVSGHFKLAPTEYMTLLTNNTLTNAVNQYMNITARSNKETILGL